MNAVSTSYAGLPAASDMIICSGCTGVRRMIPSPTASASAQMSAPPPAPMAGSPMPFAPDRVRRIGQFDRRPPHRLLDGNVENRRRLVVVQPIGERGAVVRVVDQLLAAHVAEALHGAAVDLPAERVRVHHGADVGHREVVDDPVDAGLDVHFDLDERRLERVGLPVARQVVARHAHQAQPGERRWPRPWSWR